jgi:hypothetical protein
MQDAFPAIIGLILWIGPRLPPVFHGATFIRGYGCSESGNSCNSGVLPV